MDTGCYPLPQPLSKGPSIRHLIAIGNSVSLQAYTLREQEVRSSNLRAPTNNFPVFSLCLVAMDCIMPPKGAYCTKTVPKTGQFGCAVPKVLSCSLALRSSRSRASRIIPSFAWL